MEFPLLSLIEKARAENKSERFIEAITQYVNNLESNGFPVIFTLEHFAALLKIQSDYLDSLLEKRAGFDIDDFSGEKLRAKYNSFSLRKRSGGTRMILSPHEDVKYIQKWILTNILSKHNLADSCKGFRSGVSIKDNALPHANADLILKIDLLRFFDSIEERRIFGCFKEMGYIGNLAVDLARLCTVNHDEYYWNSLETADRTKLLEKISSTSRVLPQGAPTSPYLANIVATKMDIRFMVLSKTLGFNYTRYADDLTFSIKGDATLPSLSVIRKIIDEENFIINEKKIRFSKRGESQYVTGLSITNGVNVSKKYRKKIERHLYFCAKYGVQNHLKKNKKEFFGFNTISFHDWVFGHMCFIKSVNQETYQELFEVYKLINWSIG